MLSIGSRAAMAGDVDFECESESDSEFVVVLVDIAVRQQGRNSTGRSKAYRAGRVMSCAFLHTVVVGVRCALRCVAGWTGACGVRSALRWRAWRGQWGGNGSSGGGDGGGVDRVVAVVRW